jgi:hypothetical protein
MLPPRPRVWYTWLTLVNRMLDYLYVPPTQPMDIDGWPTLADMIISNKRVVAMLAYDADQKKVRCCDIVFRTVGVSRSATDHTC